MTAAVVLDASAVLAWLQDEPGAGEVEPHLQDGFVSAVNWSEILQKVAQRGRDPRQTGALLRALGLVIVPVTQEDAEEAAATLWPQANPAGLSLADRCCLALARRLDATILTADKAWADLTIDLAITLVR
ncbi:MAG: type II toxin-antitoxin system VapC family toxin [Egibacteraceae bacterium]